MAIFLSTRENNPNAAHTHSADNFVFFAKNLNLTRRYAPFFSSFLNRYISIHLRHLEPVFDFENWYNYIRLSEIKQELSRRFLSQFQNNIALPIQPINSFKLIILSFTAFFLCNDPFLNASKTVSISSNRSAKESSTFAYGNSIINVSLLRLWYRKVLICQI